ncbi:MAG: hypothetical protein AAGF24_07070 [Cyanobacteria bacterium P01_H01_bin.121]
MTGFIRGLFGGRNRQPAKPSQAYYLDSDDAKTFGNLDYMRNPVTVRRTYAKTVSSPEEKEVILQVSSTDRKVVGETKEKSVQQNSQSNSQSTASSFSATNGSFSSSSSFASSSSDTTQRRRTDSGMDMFRDMAKDIKKRR